MPFHAHLLRHFLLVQRLHQKRGSPVTFQELRYYLLEETTVGEFTKSYSRKTFERDKEVIAETFGITIYNRRNKGYYLAIADIEDAPLTATHQRLLDAFELQEFLQLPQTLATHVQPETRRSQGLEHLRPLLRAAQAQQSVKLTYQKHWENAPKTHTVGPLLLKEFRGRWYVLAALLGSDWLTCFGLDRISELHPTGQSFTPPADFDAATYYQHAFGITRPDNGEEPQEIRLRLMPVQGRYALSYPLHASQRLVHETEEEIQVTLTVYDTHDLRMELLSYGPEVEVLVPPALRDWMSQMHQEAVL